jgi:hypothetical protein
MSYRVKVVLGFVSALATTDAHIWHAPTLDDAEKLARELDEDLAEVEHNTYIYADTRHGHVRVR